MNLKWHCFDEKARNEIFGGYDGHSTKPMYKISTKNDEEYIAYLEKDNKDQKVKFRCNGAINDARYIITDDIKVYAVIGEIS